MNHVTSEFYKEAHWTAASWEGSEFWRYRSAWRIFLRIQKPHLLKGSPLKLACSLVETQTLKVNQTVLVIGNIDHIFCDEVGLREDGSLDLNALDTVSVSGLDEYYTGEKLARLSYQNQTNCLNWSSRLLIKINYFLKII